MGSMLFNSLSFVGQKFTVGKTFVTPGKPQTIDPTATGVFQTGDELSDTTVSGFASLADRPAACRGLLQPQRERRRTMLLSLRRP